ncbi:MAG TPA: alpha-L-fucosidase [Candidatus Hydrogenedentes bacterium]|nr:alpha-L-fucosidase [Candidatus Hydrogenedentota bacterium]
MMGKKTVPWISAMILVAVLLGPWAWCADSGVPQETKEQRDARMAWWREAKFGMFIHWGLYAIPSGVWKGKDVNTAGEWIMFGGQIPVSEYEPLQKEFNPVKYNPEEWVRIAKAAGMKYITITSKHHDGFCLFDSKLTDWDVMNTPYGKDLLKPLADACHKEGVKMCWYHSILDWHNPDYLPRGAGSPRPWDTRPTEGADYNRHIDYMEGQLRELLTNYGEIGVIWFDGGWEHKAEEHRADEVAAMIRGIQPKIIINDRICIPQDFNTPEQYIPATGIKDRDWEVCMTMNDTWGYKVHDLNWKSTEDLIRKLVDIVSKGGNFLLNVGPTAEGLIPDASVERLSAIGKWMDVNGDSIYGTTASVFKRLPWGRCTVKPGKLFLQVFDWPANGELLVPGLKSDVKAAYLMADATKAPLTTAKKDDSTIVSVPAAAPDAVASVVVLEIAGAPEVVDVPFRAGADGVLEVRACDADIHGETAKYETSHQLDNIGCWTNKNDWVSWLVEIPKAGAYDVEVNYACDKGAAGATYALSVCEQKVEGKVSSTDAWSKFKTEKIGSMTFAKPGPCELAVKPLEIPSGALMNLKAVKLIPKK